MKKAYICSPYKAEADHIKSRNIEYAINLTRWAIDVGLAPITPHLYITRCVNEERPDERAAGLAAGLALMKACDYIIVGNAYGISAGMKQEIKLAKKIGIPIINICDREEKIEEYAQMYCCDFCKGSKLHTCTGYDCALPFEKARKYAARHLSEL